MSKRYFLYWVCVCVCFIGQQAYAACDLVFDNPPVFVQVTVDPTSPVSANELATFTQPVVLRNVGTGNCKGFVTISAGSLGDALYNRKARLSSPSVVDVNYQLYSQAPFSVANVVKEFSDYASDGNILGPITGAGTGKSVQLDYTVVVPTLGNEQLLSGSYTEQFVMRVYEKNLDACVSGGTCPLVDEVTVNMEIVVVDYVRFSFDTPGQQSLFLDFGMLSTGQSLPFDILVGAGSGYQLTAYSDNLGQMTHSNMYVPTRLDYQLLINGGSKDLSSATAGSPVVIINQPSPPLMDETYSASIDIGAVEPLAPGTYRDVIHFDVSNL